MKDKTAAPPANPYADPEYAQGEPTVDNLMRGLSRPLPTAGDPYYAALAAIQELHKRLAMAHYLRDVDPASLDPVIARLTRELGIWEKRLADATRDQHASVAQSNRMRRRTVRGVPVSVRRPRARGAGRPKGQSTRSSAKSGDSGEDGEPPQPPARFCACGCELDISHRAPQARYASESHAAFARQRRKRALARDLRPGVTRRDPYLRLDADEFERLRRRIETGCRCNGHHITDADDGHCTKCGHRRGWSLPSGLTIPAKSAETRRARAEGRVA